MSVRHFVVVLATAATAAVVAVVAVVAGYATGPRPVFVADTLTAQARWSPLNSQVAKVGLTDALKASGLFSIFMPTHDAFAKVPAKTMETLAGLFDEAPTLLSLAGLTAARSTFEVLNTLDGRLIG